MGKVNEKRKYEVYGSIEMPVSLEVKASKEINSITVAFNIINNYNVKCAKIQLETTDNHTITLNVHDTEINWENALINQQ